MGNRRLGAKRLETVLKRMNALSADTTGDRSGKTGFDMPAWELQPAKYWGFMDDFLVANGSTGVGAGESLAQATAIDNIVWRTNVSTGTSDTITIDAALPGGILEILHGTGDNEATFMTAINHCFKFDTSSSTARNIWWECRIKTSDISGTGFFIGLGSAAGSEETDADGADIEDACGFYVADGAASEVLTLLTAEDDNETATSLSHTVVDDTYMTLSFYFSGPDIKAYVNGSLKATVGRGTTGFPDGTIVFPYISVAAREGAANTVSVDYIRCCMER
jgi:hypothetical protein